jgi:hypothetical protein
MFLSLVVEVEVHTAIQMLLEMSSQEQVVVQELKDIIRV